MNATDELLIDMYRRMARIRSFEEAVTKLARRGELPGAVHTSIGQEGEIVGACVALRSDDYMLGNHRSHGHPIAKGAALPPLMAEIFGKATGVCAGKGGSMHLADFSVGSLGETSIVGSGIPVATGAALGAKMQGSDKVVLCFFGDGAANEGAFHESLNMAAVWDLPVIYLCENNGYGLTTPMRTVTAVDDIATRADSYGMPGVIVDGQSVTDVYDAVTLAVDRARRGDGPSLVEAKTYRYDNHAVGLHVEDYRTGEEIEHWRTFDPITLHRQRLLDSGVLTEVQADSILESTTEAVAEALAFARQSDYPRLEGAFDHVFTNPAIALTD